MDSQIGGSQGLCTPAPYQASSVEDNFGFVVNVFNLFQLAGVYAIAPVYTSYCPTENNVKELRKILKSWRRVLDNLDPEQKAQFEIDHPGEFDGMLESIGDYEDRLEEFKVDLRRNRWSRYLPVKTGLSREYNDLCEDIKTLDRDYYNTTKNYRRTQRNRAARQAAGNTARVPAPNPETVTGDNVEMLPIAQNAVVEVPERRLINQDTIDQTERYRSILRVYANHNVPPAMRSTYAAIENFVTSLLSRPNGSVTMMPV
ncbi:hypothetical protein V8D89_013683 [Ganoderma adspersum]